MIDPDDLDFATPQIREMFIYWLGKRSGCSVPRRSDFDPLDIPRHLPGIMLIEFEGETPGGAGIYRYRVVGDWEVEARGHNPTGKLVEEGYHAASREAALRTYDRVRRDKQPLYEKMDFQNERGLRIREHSIVLPFSEDGETVSQILVYSERIKQS